MIEHESVCKYSNERRFDVKVHDPEVYRAIKDSFCSYITPPFV